MPGLSSPAPRTKLSLPLYDYHPFLDVVGVFTALFPASARKARLPGEAEEQAVDGERRIPGDTVRAEDLGAQ